MADDAIDTREEETRRMTRDIYVGACILERESDSFFDDVCLDLIF
ncbi:MAG: hypothetical protein ACRD2Z_13140 [Thermoanaerobaculia bacterium]